VVYPAVRWQTQLGLRQLGPGDPGTAWRDPPSAPGLGAGWAAASAGPGVRPDLRGLLRRVPLRYPPATPV